MNKLLAGKVLDAPLRAVADFVIIHMVMLTALACVTLQLQNMPGATVRDAVAVLRSYYICVFLPLSFLFPGIYAVGGLYTRARGYALSLKLQRAAASAAFASLIILVASWLVSPETKLPRVPALVFFVLVLIATPGVRWFKYRLFERENNDAAIGSDGETVLVVGGAGYIGSILVRKLLARGYRVRILDNLVYGDGGIADIMNHPRITFVEADCRNIKDVVSAMKGVWTVIHLAAIVGDPACDMDHQTTREVNYAATRMMIEIAKGEHVERFVFASSCSVYGVTDKIMHENSELRPISLYAETKMDSEEALLAAAADDFHPTILRFSTIFGLSPRPRFDLVVNILTAKAMQEGAVSIFNGEQWRPFLHVSDAAESIVRVLEAPVRLVGAQIYNVGDDRLNYTLNGVAEKIGEIFPGTRIDHTASSDRRSYRVCFDKIRRHLGFTCSKTVVDGVLELKSALERGLISDYRAPLYSNVKSLQEYGTPRQKDGIAVQVMAALAQKALHCETRV
jgi:nucleoside-diphosphate-sugar epimerase